MLEGVSGGVETEEGGGDTADIQTGGGPPGFVIIGSEQKYLQEEMHGGNTPATPGFGTDAIMISISIY
jgi:hypothetical protein